ncbi:hypothetical protein CMI37_00760 [Candidatus Pacearchaeota archaeon]|nr:hypothetical protein [Candidatus Pacearchaeota archaeon]
MSTKTETTTKVTPQLKEQVNAHDDQLAQLRSRINELTDNLVLVQQELNAFKRDVADDVKYLTNAVN